MIWNKQIIRFVVVMLIQVLILNQLQFFGICHPYVFILTLLMMPITLSRRADMLIGALVGLTMDAFCNSLGIHMAACVLITYLRRPMISNLVMDDDRLKGEISSQTIGVANFVRCAVTLIIVYHILVVMLSAWSFAHIGMNLLQIVCSSLLGGLIIIGYDILRNK